MRPFQKARPDRKPGHTASAAIESHVHRRQNAESALERMKAPDTVLLASLKITAARVLADRPKTLARVLRRKI